MSTSFPELEVPVAIDRWGQLAGQWHDDGVLASLGSPDLECYADSSGMQIKVRPGEDQIRGIHGVEAGVTLPVPANTSSYARIDRVVRRLDSTGEITSVLLQGTASSAPTAPSLTPLPPGILGQYPLGSFRVGAGAVTVAASDRAADERRFTSTRRLHAQNLSYVDTARVRRWQEVVIADGSVYSWDGTIWQPVRKRVQHVSPLFAAGNGVIPFTSGDCLLHELADGLVHVEANYYCGAGGDNGSGLYLGNLPTPYFPGSIKVAAASLNGHSYDLRYNASSSGWAFYNTVDQGQASGPIPAGVNLQLSMTYPRA